MLPSPIKVNMETVRGFIDEMGLTSVLNFIVNHSTTDKRFPRARMLWQLAVRGNTFELTGNKKEPLKMNDRPYDIVDLDSRALWN